MNLLDLLPYTTVLGYLAVVTAALWAVDRVPVWLHPAALLLGIPAQVWHQGWGSTSIAVAIGVGAVLFGVLVAHRLLTGAGLFTIATSIALAPFGGWFGLLGGLLLAAVVGTARTISVAGVDRVHLKTVETMHAMGVTGMGVVKPNPDLLPQREDAAQVIVTDEHARRMRLHLPPYLLAGVAVAGALAAMF